MNYLVFISLLIATFIRLIGLIPSFDLFIDSRNSGYKMFIVGWILWIISVIFPIGDVITEDFPFLDLVRRKKKKKLGEE